ncbi:MAG: glycosyltransferase family 8 protein [Faecalibacterium sp.]|nr:glycosyltransferase family 8 protein [Faecalibacterium sp.]
METPRLGIFYTCNDAYAPFAGVSMVSCFENNRDMPGLAAYLIGDGISAENRQKLADAAKAYGRTFTLIDAAPVLETIRGISIAAWRNTTIANARIFYEEAFAGVALPPRLLYLDCDTLITGSLAPLAAFDLGEKAAGMVQDSLAYPYKATVGFAPEEAYCNAGVLLIDTAAWRAHGCTKALIAHLRDTRKDYVMADQDILNVVLKDDRAVLPATYNAQPIHRAYRAKDYFAVYPQPAYYAPAELEAAAEKAAIRHTFRFLGDFPWHAGNLHPDTPEFDRYLALSPWKGYEKKPSGGGAVFRLEKLLYRTLPKRWFLRLFAAVQLHGYQKQEAALQARHKAG